MASFHNNDLDMDNTSSVGAANPSSASPAVTNLLANLSTDDLDNLLTILEQRRAATPPIPQPAQQPVQQPTQQPVQQLIQRRNATLPKWNGRVEDFPFYISRLQTRISTEQGPHIAHSSICLDMIDSLPEDRQGSVAVEFGRMSATGNFDYVNFIECFKQTFADYEARQTAAETVSRMYQGGSQLFTDFLKDFNYRVALAGGDEAFTPLGKTQQLKGSLNKKLRKVLIGIKLGDPSNFEVWVENLKEVARDLEAMEAYQKKGDLGTSTVIGPPKTLGF
ncbi:hypothetical protein K3495_g16227, partial [Podosphaera aphanis]